MDIGQYYAMIKPNFPQNVLNQEKFLKLSKQYFLDLISKYPEFGSFFRQSERQTEPTSDVANSLITATISDIMTNDPVTMNTSMSIQDAATFDGTTLNFLRSSLRK